MKHFLKNTTAIWILCSIIISCKPNAESPTVDSEILEVKTETSVLKKHTVLSDGHPMAVWEKAANDPKGIILFVHGRTWSSVPDFDLQVEGEDLSLMDGMIEQGYTTYAVDLRGYGETPRDESEWMTPNKGAKDVQNVLQWVSEQHNGVKVHLFGWSMGSTVSLLATQQNPQDVATLTLFGFWRDLDVDIPEDPKDRPLDRTPTTAEAAASDFITPGSISQNAIDTYVEVALKSDPVRVDWRDMDEFEQINPLKIELPVLIMQGELDPIAPTDLQAKLFTRLKTADKSWAVISGGDHAAFMETPRTQFIKVLNDFIERFNP